MVVSWLNLGLKRPTQKPEFQSLNFVWKKGRSFEEGKNRVQVKGNDLTKKVLNSVREDNCIREIRHRKKGRIRNRKSMDHWIWQCTEEEKERIFALGN
jgi:hypothetical protein